MMRPGSGAMTVSSPSGAGLMMPVAWRTARIDPVLASSTLTGTGASLSVSSAVCLLHAAIVAIAAIKVATNHGDTEVTETKRLLRDTFMAAELLSRVRDPQGLSGIDRSRRAIAV